MGLETKRFQIMPLSLPAPSEAIVAKATFFFFNIALNDTDIIVIYNLHLNEN